METMRISLPDIPQKPQRSLTSFLSYSKQLEEFISKYKTRPHDIKFWPYGPYWPPYFQDEILEAPRHVYTCPEYKEAFQKKWDGKYDGNTAYIFCLLVSFWCHNLDSIIEQICRKSNIK